MRRGVQKKTEQEEKDGPKKIGEFIANLRKERGLTQKQLAEEIGVSDKTISKWECGGSHS